MHFAGKFLGFPKPADRSGYRQIVLAEQRAPNAGFYFQSLIDDRYDHYGVELVGLKTPNDNVDVVLHISQDNGATWRVTSGQYVAAAFAMGSGGSANQTGNRTGVVLTDNAATFRNTGNASFSGWVDLFNPLSTIDVKLFTFDSAWISGVAATIAWASGAMTYLADNAPYNAVRIIAGAGVNFSAGYARFIGFKRSN